jgi:hypothetical protein
MCGRHLFSQFSPALSPDNAARQRADVSLHSRHGEAMLVEPQHERDIGDERGDAEQHHGRAE